MSGNETGTRDMEFMVAFRKLIAQRKGIPSKLEELMSIYEELKPHLPVSELCRVEIHHMIKQAIKKTSGELT